jgi:transposase-like protein
MTFDEFIKRFSTEEQCEEYLCALRWENGFRCPKCGGAKSWKTKRLLYMCKSCGLQTSVTAGTIFQDTRKPLRSWFIAIWWIMTPRYGASAEGLKQVLGLKSDETAWTWLHKIRNAMVRPAREKLTGEIEVDECYIGGCFEGKAGRGSENKTLVAVAVETEEMKLGRVRMSVIKDASGNSLVPFVVENIVEGSTIVSDGWRGFSDIEKHGFKQIIRKHSEAADEDEMLPHVHLVVSLLKRWLLGTHQGAVEPKYLQSYLDEYVFRFNRRTSAKRGLLFHRLLENAMVVSPCSLENIKKGRLLE